MPNEIPQENLTDTQLLEILYSQPAEGWNLFWARYGHLITYLIAKFKPSPEDFEEIRQSVQLRLFENDLHALRIWEPQRCPLQSYLSVITLNICRTFFTSLNRQKKRQVSYLEKLTSTVLEEDSRLIDPAPTARERLHRFEIATIVRACLDQWEREGDLSKEDRQILELRTIGMNPKEIAEILDLPSTYVSSRFFRLKGYLRNRLVEAGMVAEDLLW
jgi:RNA polymerase sigma factor (sigma-70 family)